MKKLTKKEIKEIDLKILLYFDSFCKKNKLRYYLSGGTLLGAIRHKGFIPWDDDIDVCMPRDDYEKLIKIYNNNGRFFLMSKEKNGYVLPISKIIDKKTKIKNKFLPESIGNSLWIDIIPIDGLPENTKTICKIYKKISLYRLLLMLSLIKNYSSKNSFKKFFKVIIIYFSKLIGSKYWSDKIDNISRIYKYNSSKYVGAVGWGLYGIGECMKKSEFEKVVYVEFEGYKFPTFSCWDSYLKGLYKNYMELPPIEKRKTHDMEAYYIGDDKE